MLKRLRIRFVAVIMVIVTAMLCLIFGTIYSFTKSGMEAESISMMQAVAAGGGYYDLSDEQFLKSLADAAFAQKQQTGIIEEYNLRFCKVAAPMGQSLVFADMSSALATLSSLARICILIGVLCFAVFLGISILLAFWMVRPVESAWEQQRRFVADASHELKTPLTVIMSNAELLQLPEYDAENKARFADRILTMSRHMRGLVERLLELARTDDGRQRTVRARLNLGELVEYSLLPFEPLFFEKGLEIVADIQPNIFVAAE